MKTKIVNLTPHEITICGLVIPPSGIIARLSEETKIMRTIIVNEVEIPIIAKFYGKIVDLPEPEVDTVFVVSLLVAQQAQRGDVFAIGESIRNGKGQIVGAKSLLVL